MLKNFIVFFKIFDHYADDACAEESTTCLARSPEEASCIVSHELQLDSVSFVITGCEERGW